MFGCLCENVEIIAISRIDSQGTLISKLLSNTQRFRSEMLSDFSEFSWSSEKMITDRSMISIWMFLYRILLSRRWLMFNSIPINYHLPGNVFESEITRHPRNVQLHRKLNIRILDNLFSVDKWNFNQVSHLFLISIYLPISQVIILSMNWIWACVQFYILRYDKTQISSTSGSETSVSGVYKRCKNL